jgi:putative hemolysin
LIHGYRITHSRHASDVVCCERLGGAPGVRSVHACPETGAAPPPAAAPTSSIEQPAQRANPASEHCVASDGRLAIEALPNGAKYGACMFEDNRQCEEWALLRGECPVGGKRITGYATSAGRYCAITGGEYTMKLG